MRASTRKLLALHVKVSQFPVTELHRSDRGGRSLASVSEITVLRAFRRRCFRLTQFGLLLNRLKWAALPTYEENGVTTDGSRGRQGSSSQMSLAAVTMLNTMLLPAPVIPIISRPMALSDLWRSMCCTGNGSPTDLPVSGFMRCA